MLPNYTYEVVLSIQAPAGGLPSGMVIESDADTKSLISSGKCRPDRKDFRLTYNGAEIDRVMLTTGRFAFRLQAAIAEGQTSNAYAINYGYAGETTDPKEDPRHVWPYYVDGNDLAGFATTGTVTALDLPKPGFLKFSMNPTLTRTPSSGDYKNIREVELFYEDGYYWATYDADDHGTYDGHVGWTTYLARSTDLINWTKYGEILVPGTTGDGRQDHASASDLIIHKFSGYAGYYGTYLGTNSLGFTSVPSPPYVLHGATASSVAGPWTKTGILLPLGGEGEIDSGYNVDAYIFHRQGDPDATFYMVYGAWNSSTAEWTSALARSTTGPLGTYTKLGAIITGGTNHAVENPRIVDDGDGHYYLLNNLIDFLGVGAVTRTNVIHWSSSFDSYPMAQATSIIEPSESGWDSFAIGVVSTPIIKDGMMYVGYDGADYTNWSMADGGTHKYRDGGFAEAVWPFRWGKAVRVATGTATTATAVLDGEGKVYVKARLDRVSSGFGLVGATESFVISSSEFEDEGFYWWEFGLTVNGTPTAFGTTIQNYSHSKTWSFQRTGSTLKIYCQAYEVWSGTSNEDLKVKGFGNVTIEEITLKQSSFEGPDMPLDGTALLAESEPEPFFQLDGEPATCELVVYKVDENGAMTVIGPAQALDGLDGLLRLEAQGSRLRAFYNGSLKHDFEDQTYTEGAPGIFSLRSSRAGWGDNFDGGDVGEYNPLVLGRAWEASGGAVCGSSADMSSAVSAYASGGSIAGSTAEYAVTSAQAAANGALAGGGASAQQDVVAVSDSGAISGSAATFSAARLCDADGGALAGGVGSLALEASASGIGGGICGNGALASCVVAISSLEGALAGGAADVALAASQAATSGGIVGGLADTSDARNYESADGAIAGGEALQQQAKQEEAVGGGIIGGLADMQTKGAYAWEAVGGCLAGGQAGTSQSNQFYASGGGICSGLIECAQICAISSESGAVVAGEPESSTTSCYVGEGGFVSGSSAEEQRVCGFESTGGAVCGGFSDVATTGEYSWVAAGGALAGSQAAVVVEQVQASVAGAIAGGEAAVSTVTGNVQSYDCSGGSVCGGQADTISINVSLSVGGAISGGSASWYTSGFYEQEGDGGAIAGSGATLQKIAVEAVLGGGITGSYADLLAQAVRQGEGGALSGGASTQAKGFESFPAGGALTGGTATRNDARAYESSGGSLAGGLAAQLRDVFAPMFGGGYAGGQGELVFIKITSLPASGGTLGGALPFSFGRAIDIGGGSVSAGTADVWRVVDIHPQEGGISAGLADVVARMVFESLGGVLGGGRAILELYSTSWARYIRVTIDLRVPYAIFTLKRPSAGFTLKVGESIIAKY